MKKEEGYIAITSAIIVSLLLLGSALLISSGNFSGYANSQLFEAKEIGYSVSEGCVNYVRLKLSSGAYAGGETISISSYSCIISSVQDQGTTYLFQVSVTVRNTMTNLRIVLNKLNLSIGEWREIP